jgi:hypothetical protein
MRFPLTPRATTIGTLTSAIKPVLPKSLPYPLVLVAGVISDFQIIANAMTRRYMKTIPISARVMEEPNRMKGESRDGLNGRCERRGVICGGGRNVGSDVDDDPDLDECVSKGLDLADVGYRGGIAEGKPEFRIQPVLRSPPPTFLSSFSPRYRGILPGSALRPLVECIEANKRARNLPCETAIHSTKSMAKTIIKFRGVVPVSLSPCA